MKSSLKESEVVMQTRTEKKNGNQRASLGIRGNNKMERQRERQPVRFLFSQEEEEEREREKETGEKEGDGPLHL
jgi:hypothetical protein